MALCAAQTCGSEKVTYLQKARLYKCYGDHPARVLSESRHGIRGFAYRSGEVATRILDDRQ